MKHLDTQQAAASRRARLRRRLLPVALVGAVILLAPVAAADGAPEVTSEQVDGLRSAVGEVSGLGVAKSSEPTATPIPFTMLGFEIPEGAEVWFRTSEDGEDWTPWIDAPPLDADEGPDAGGSEDRDAEEWTQMSDAIWVGESQWLQTAVFGGEPEDVTAHLIDAHGLSETFTQRVGSVIQGLVDRVTPSAEATPALPGVISRSQWGANEDVSGDPSYASNVRYGVVHHTAGPNTYTRAQAPGRVAGIQHYHAVILGWKDIGYNVLIDRFGQIYEGRKGGLDRTVIGAHARGFNTGSYGVAILGTFSTTTPSSASLDALTKVLGWKSAVHDIDPEATITVTSGGSNKYPSGRKVTMSTVIGHRDVGKTSCPGDRLYNQLPNLRKSAAFEARVLGTDSGIIPLSGDWNGDGYTTQGWFVDGRVYQRNRNGSIRSFSYGRKGDLPVVGDWNGNGVQTVGIVRDGRWHLRNSNTKGDADISFKYGRILDGDYPLSGDWNGNGVDTIGIVRSGEWHLRNSNSAGDGQVVFIYGRVRQGDVPVTGDWSGDGQDTPGIVRGREWHLRLDNASGHADIAFTFGRAGDRPVVGDWNASGTTTPGIVRGSTWHMRNYNSSGGASSSVDFVP